jgi:hypothetical protein
LNDCTDNGSDDEEEDKDKTDSDDDDFLPTMDWYAPQGVEKQCLLGDEEELLRVRVTTITTPPVMLRDSRMTCTILLEEKMIF